jgi:hypothetical protein
MRLVSMTGSKTDGIIGHYLAGQQSILEEEKVDTFSSADFSTANAWSFSDGIWSFKLGCKLVEILSRQTL